MLSDCVTIGVVVVNIRCTQNFNICKKSFSEDLTDSLKVILIQTCAEKLVQPLHSFAIQEFDLDLHGDFSQGQMSKMDED